MFFGVPQMHLDSAFCRVTWRMLCLRRREIRTIRALPFAVPGRRCGPRSFTPFNLGNDKLIQAPRPLLLHCTRRTRGQWGERLGNLCQLPPQTAPERIHAEAGP